MTMKCHLWLSSAVLAVALLRPVRTARCNNINVAFVASRASKTRSGRVHFRNEVLNDGGGWDPLHAEFVTPIDGLYQISYSALPGGNQVLRLSVHQNEQVLLRGYGDRQLSGQLLVRLASRDRVWLEVMGGSLYEDPGRLTHAYTTLSGYMVAGDLVPCYEPAPGHHGHPPHPLPPPPEAWQGHHHHHNPVIGRILPVVVPRKKEHGKKKVTSTTTVPPPLYRRPGNGRLNLPSKSAAPTAADAPLAALTSVIRRVQAAQTSGDVVLPKPNSR